MKTQASQNFKVFCSMVTVLNQEQWNEKSFLIEPRELDTIHENQNSSCSSSASSTILQSPTSEDSDSSIDSIFGIESDDETIKSVDNLEEPGQLSFDMMEAIYMSPVQTRFRSSLRFHRTSSYRFIEINKNRVQIRAKEKSIPKREQPVWGVDLSLNSSDLEFVQNEMWLKQNAKNPTSPNVGDDSDLSLQLVLLTRMIISFLLNQFSFQ